jgi:hypothetical protein
MKARSAAMPEPEAGALYLPVAPERFAYEIVV